MKIKTQKLKGVHTVVIPLLITIHFAVCNLIAESDKHITITRVKMKMFLILFRIIYFSNCLLFPPHIQFFPYSIRNVFFFNLLSFSV